jgi:hypothetical protein
MEPEATEITSIPLASWQEISMHANILPLSSPWTSIVRKEFLS